MTDDTDIDQLLARAAAPERARHVDPAFVQHIEEIIAVRSRAALLDFLPAFTVVFAVLFVVPSLAGFSFSGLVLSFAGFWESLSEPLGLQLLIETTTKVASFVRLGDDAATGFANLWPYAVGVAAVLTPFWMSTSDA